MVQDLSKLVVPRSVSAKTGFEYRDRLVRWWQQRQATHFVPGTQDDGALMTQLHGRGNRMVLEEFKTSQQQRGAQFCIVLASLLRIPLKFRQSGSVIEG